jgi:hypothetical protein
MPCATFRTVPFQWSGSYNIGNYALRTFRALVLLKAHSSAKYFSTKWLVAQAIELPGRKSELQWKLQQMPDIQPVALPNPPKVIYTQVYCMWLWCQESELAHAPSPCLNTNPKPRETLKSDSKIAEW